MFARHQGRLINKKTNRDTRRLEFTRDGASTVGDSTVFDPVIVPVRDPVIVPVLEPVIVPLRATLEPFFEPVMVPPSPTVASASIMIVAVNSI